MWSRRWRLRQRDSSVQCQALACSTRSALDDLGIKTARLARVRKAPHYWSCFFPSSENPYGTTLLALTGFGEVFAVMTTGVPFVY